MWLECAKETFKALDPNDDGVVAVDDLLNMLKDKLGHDDVDLAVAEAMARACAEDCGLTFDDFVKLLSNEQTDGDAPGALYETRFVGSPRVANQVSGGAADSDASAKVADSGTSAQ